MTAVDLAEFDIARRDQRRRTPLGDRMQRFRWGLREGAVWMWPAALVSPAGLVLQSSRARWSCGPVAAPVPLAFWIAHAARQDLWRALRGVSGLQPLLRIRVDPEARAVDAMLGALVPRAKASPAVESVLRDIYVPKRLDHWTGWAERRVAEARPGA